MALSEKVRQLLYVIAARPNVVLAEGESDGAANVPSLRTLGTNPTQAAPGDTAGAVYVSGNDQATGRLIDKVAAGTGIAISQQNDGSDEDLLVGLDLASSNTFSAGQNVEESTLTEAASVAVDCDVSNNFSLILTASTSTMAAPTNAIKGSIINIVIRQDATGSHTLAWDAAYKFPGGTPTITATANAIDLVSCYVSAVDGSGNATELLCSIAQDHQ